jgi:hypothetical protein
LWGFQITFLLPGLGPVSDLRSRYSDFRFIRVRADRAAVTEGRLAESPRLKHKNVIVAMRNCPCDIINLSKHALKVETSVINFLVKGDEVPNPQL